MENKARESAILAGEIAKKVVVYARGIAKKNVALLELAEKIEAKIVEFGGKPAFPVNLSINEMAAHVTPNYNSSEKAHGLLKVDLGVQVEGYTADTAFSVDLADDAKNIELIKAAEAGLAEAMKHVRKGAILGELGRLIEEAITKGNDGKIVPVRNLTGHSIDQYEIHGSLTVPNHNSGSTEKLSEGLFAFEPFTTYGNGSVRDGKLSGIYQVVSDGNVRSDAAREVLEFIDSEYRGLPFCTRWIYNKFGARGVLALREIAKSGVLHEYAELVEASGGRVAQAEHTVLIEKDKVTILT